MASNNNDTATTQDSTLAGTLDEATLQQRIDEAVQAAISPLKAELTALKTQLQDDARRHQQELERNLTNIIQRTIATVTTSTDTPFVTKAEHATFAASVDRLSETTDAIWEFLRNGKGRHIDNSKEPPKTPVRPTKKTNTQASPGRDNMDTEGSDDI